MTAAVSSTPTPYAVHCTGLIEGHECEGGGPIYLTEEEYLRQLDQGHRPWQCPYCRAEAWWDDDVYEAALAVPADPESVS